MQSRDPAEGVRLRLPALLPAQPARVPGAGSDRPRQPGAAEAGAEARTCAPTARATRSSRRRARPRIAPTSSISGATTWSTFLIGSGITIDGPLERAGVPTHQDRWVLRTTVPTEPAGPFRGDLIVTMRWLTRAAGAHRHAGDVAFSVQSRRADPHRRSGRRSAPILQRRCSAAGAADAGRASCRCSGPAASPRRARPRTPSCRSSSRMRPRTASLPTCRRALINRDAA